MSRSWGDSGRLACRLHRSRVSKAGELAALRFSAPYLAAETRALRTPCPSWLITLVRDRPANSSSGPNRACRSSRKVRQRSRIAAWPENIAYLQRSYLWYLVMRAAERSRLVRNVQRVTMTLRLRPVPGWWKGSRQQSCQFSLETPQPHFDADSPYDRRED